MKTYIAPSLLQPDNHAVLLIDYQYLQLLSARSQDPQGVIGSAVLLAGIHLDSKIKELKIKKHKFLSE